MSDSEEEFIPEEEAEAGPAALKKLREKFAACTKEKQEYLEGWQRARADFANAKRQFEEEKSAMKSYAASAAAEALLPALDSLERARAAGELPADFAGIAKQLSDGFAGLGIEQILPKAGDDFNPREHEALQQEPVEKESLDGTVVQVLSPGWKTENQVLRPARVSVGSYNK